MQPCILTPTAVAKDDSATADLYLTSLFYQGYWAAKQLTLEVGDEAIGLTNSATSGKCNVVYVSIVVTEAQKLELQKYSQTFKVRIVYFNAAETAGDPEVNQRLGISQYFVEPLLSPPSVKLTTAGAADARVVNTSLTTDLRALNLFTRPVHQIATVNVNGTSTIVANYADSNGSVLLSALSYPSVAAMTYVSTSGYEEMHVFFSMAWFDVGSWAWGHYFVEWGTKGIFQGERRFYMAAMVDDFFLATKVFVYDGDSNQGAEVRTSALDMAAYKAQEASINARYGSSIKTEFPFNGNGVLKKVGSKFALDTQHSQLALLPKGEKVDGDGMAPILPEGWLSTAVPGMKAEMAAGNWSSDDLLEWVLSNKGDFWWQSHTMSHLSRDNLGQSDCEIEDGGSAQFAVITGLFKSANYNWRSMTNPGITGLFNHFCLTSAMANLNKCGPGDNVYDGVHTPVKLVSTSNRFHSIYTSTATNGAPGFQIVPRWASFVYYNCADGDCLLNENEHMRRVMCGCTNLDPSQDKGTCTDCGDNILSFGSIEALFEQEAKTATRQVLMGHRDKYMFHQANLVPTPLSGGSLLGHWFEEVMALFTTYIAFPVTSIKFDDLCSEFTLHEQLDASGVLVTATMDTVSGEISSLSLSSSGIAGYIPFTVPNGTIISTSGVTVGSTQNYGSDTTYYLTTNWSAIPTPAKAPCVRKLAPVPVASPTSIAN